MKLNHLIVLLFIGLSLVACKSEDNEVATSKGLELAKELQKFRQYMGRVPQLNESATAVYDEVMGLVSGYYLYDYDEEMLYQAAVDGMLSHNNPRDASDLQLVEAGMTNLLRQLDTYSSYYDRASFYALNESTSGEFGGLGIEVKSHPLGLEVISAFKNTPADRAGILPRDVITEVNRHNLAGMNMNTIIQLLRGPAGSTVDLHTRRFFTPDGDTAGESKAQNDDKNYKDMLLTLTREIIEVPSLEAKLLHDGAYGYIRLTHFNDHSGEELTRAMDELHQSAEKMQAWIIDVRNNPGGVLSQALVISDAFLTKGEIVSTHAKAKKKSYKADNDDFSRKMPVAILINEGSASASEIFAGALKDLDRAVLIGKPTFGKGVVQTLFPLENGGGIKLTTSEYLTPNGHSVSGGIMPDLTSSDDPNTQEDEVIETAISMIHKQIAISK